MVDTATINMTSVKPYLIRACYEWILDNNLTPQIAINTDFPEIFVPQQFYAEKQLVLNIAPTATHNLRIGNDALECKARFGGVSHELFIPIDAILAIYARENDQGMVFNQEELKVTQPATATSLSKQQPTKPKLKIISGGKKDN